MLKILAEIRVARNWLGYGRAGNGGRSGALMARGVDSADLIVIGGVRPKSHVCETGARHWGTIYFRMARNGCCTIDIEANSCGIGLPDHSQRS